MRFQSKTYQVCVVPLRGVYVVRGAKPVPVTKDGPVTVMSGRGGGAPKWFQVFTNPLRAKQ